MIHKIKTVTWEVRSHGHETTISNEGIIIGSGIGWDNIRKPTVKKLIWHLQDVLKCIKQIEKEKETKIPKGKLIVRLPKEANFFLDKTIKKEEKT